MTIWTSKGAATASTPQQAAGIKQERDVAFYLRRAFKESPDFIVFNDLAFSHQGENAQIDHLIIHRFGFLIIESKSITGEVKVNNRGEWTRSYKGQWAGIASPIRQAEQQLELLKLLLRDNIKQVLGKILGIQQGIKYRKWEVCCAVSNSCIIRRDDIPEALNARIIKSEAIAKAVKERGEFSRIDQFIKAIPAFSYEEMDSIASFLLSRAQPTDTCQPYETPPVAKPVQVEEAPAQPIQQVAKSSPPERKALLQCKQCGEQQRLNGMYGKYGYYVKCRSCGTNTSMKQPCIHCQHKAVKIRKDKDEYWLQCKCSAEYLLFAQPVEN